MDNILATPDVWRAAMAAYPVPLQPERVEFLDSAGGFSGAQFWRLETSVGPLCLRRWPLEHPSAERLTLIHDVLRHAAARGLDFLPVPLLARDGHSWVAHDGAFWELTPWLAGEGNFSRDPRPEKLCAALVALARFHAATADFPSPACRVAPSPGIADRLARLRGWTVDELRRLRASVLLPLPPAGEGWGEGLRDGRIGIPSHEDIVTMFERLAPRVDRQLTAALPIAMQLQPAIRDIWADHFLFTGDAVTGLVDFGGLNIDTPATDIARLLGSLAGDDRVAWQSGLSAYVTIRPLASAERQLIPIFDQSSVALAGMNWLRWIYLERREFADWPTITLRLSAIADRMRSLCNSAEFA